MSGNPTTQRQRATLAAAGFVRVDGLKMHFLEGVIVGNCTIEPTVENFGRCYREDDVIVIVTVSGEVWTAMVHEANQWLFDDLIAELCPNGKGGVAPWGNGEDLDIRHIFARLANPDWQPK